MRIFCKYMWIKKLTWVYERIFPYESFIRIIQNNGLGMELQVYTSAAGVEGVLR